jgi:hypothetical protein
MPAGVTAPNDTVLLNPDTAILICCSDCEAKAASAKLEAAKVTLCIPYSHYYTSSSKFFISSKNIIVG